MTTLAERTAAVDEALERLARIERFAAHARLALQDIQRPDHPRHFNVIDARDEAYVRVRAVSELADLLVDRIGNLPGIDPDVAQ